MSNIPAKLEGDTTGPKGRPGSEGAAEIIRVAIVEDHASMLDRLQSLFSSTAGFQFVGGHTTGEEALQRLPQEKPDVVLVDINLPGLDGVECVARLKAVMPATVFVIHTVYENTERIFRAVQAGASGYLLKRTDPAVLLQAVREARHGGAPLNSLIARKMLDAFREHQPAPRQETDGRTMVQLSDREQQVLEKLAKGFIIKEIADQMGVSYATIRTYKERIYQKLHVRSRSELVTHYLQGQQ